MAWLQNKIADYAYFLADFQYTDEKAPPDQAALVTFIRHQEIKAKLVVLEELFGELNVPKEVMQESPQQDQ